jgi:hypothetical protein
MMIRYNIMPTNSILYYDARNYNKCSNEFIYHNYELNKRRSYYKNLFDKPYYNGILLVFYIDIQNKYQEQEINI